MALKKEALTRIASILKIKETDLEAAIKDEKEVDLTIDDKLETFSADELTTLKNNEYNNGKKAGAEMEVKAVKEKLKLDFTGKTVEGLLEAHGKKVLEDAKIEPEKKVQEVTEKLTNLQKNYGELEEKMKAKDAEIAQVKDLNEFGQYIPKVEDGPVYRPEEVLQLMKLNGYDYKRNEAGEIVFSKGGKEVLDKVSKAVAPSEVITGFMKERKLIPEEFVPGGRGGKDHKPAGGKFTKLSEVTEHFKAQGKSTLGEEFMSTVSQLKEANKDFDLNG